MNKHTKKITLTIITSATLTAGLTACVDDNSTAASRASYTSIQQCEKQWGKKECRKEGSTVYSPYFFGSTYYPYTGSTASSYSTTTPRTTPSSVVMSGGKVVGSSSTVSGSISRGGFGGMSASSAS